MRESAKKFTKAIISFILCMSLILPLCQSISAYTNGMGMGDLVFNERREIAPGVFLDTWLGKTPSGTPKRAYTMLFNPKTSDALVLATYGDYINSRKTLSKMISGAEAEGHMVIGGINGDFYVLDNGVPLGIVIRDGRLVSNNGSPKCAIGFRKDGSVIIGTPKFQIKALLDYTEFICSNLNKAQGDWGPYIYTSDFGTTTGSSVPSIEIVVDISMGTMAVGSMVIGKVASVNPNTKSTPIGKDQIVLSARIGKTGESALSKLRVGDSISFSVIDPDGQWGQVDQAIGGGRILLSDGTIPIGTPTNDVNPYTAVGVKANGEVVFLEVDGRNSANSVGISSMDAARFLKDVGCVDAISMDGGGSSTIAARLPGSFSPQILNKPSDGYERSNSNALILVSKQFIKVNNKEADANLKANRLHIYPGKALVLPGSSLIFTAAATNDYFFPVSLPQNIVWKASGGQFKDNGEYIAPDAVGTYQISASSGGVSGSASVEVISPERITVLKPNPASLSLLPGMKKTIELAAEMDNLKIPFSNNRLVTWQVEGNVGSITQDGVFTAAGSGGAQGAIKATLGKQTAVIPVTIAQEPVILEGFEGNTAWGASGIRSASQSVSVVKDPLLAAFGDKALRLDYDLTLSPGVESGTAGVYAFPANTDGTSAGILLDKTPTAIGMWVYGDNAKAWLRARVRDGSGQAFDIDFTSDYRPDTGTGGIDWTGWKYVEAKIPSGKKEPLTLELPVRVMCSRDSMRTKGTIYIDQIRAIYGLKNDDMILPTGNIVSPADQSVLTTGKTLFRAELSDNMGIDPKNVRLFVDGVLITDTRMSAGDGSLAVEADLGAAIPLADGLHVAEIRFTDLFGNKASRTVSFMVETGAPQVVAFADSRVSEDGSFNYNINVKNPNTLKKLYLLFSYDKDSLEVVDADSSTPGTQVALEGWVGKGRVIGNSADAVNGRVVIEVDGLNASSKEGTLKAASIKFRKKAGASKAADVSLILGAMITGSNERGACFSLPVAEVDLEYAIVLSAQGFTIGDETLIRVTDKSGNPVPDALVYNSGRLEYLIGKTDAQGTLKTGTLTGVVGNPVSLRAEKGGVVSNIVRFNTAEAGTGLKPKALSITFDDNATALKFNYQTDASQTGTIMEIMEKSRFTGIFTGSFMTVEGTDRESIILKKDDAEMVRTHSASVSGLKPGTAYVYRFKDASGRTSDVGEFVWPDTGRPYSFVFLTDPQGVGKADYDVYADVLRRAVAFADNPAFALIAGDMVDRGNNVTQWDLFFSASSEVFSRLPVMMAAGNHEKYDDSGLTNFRTYLGHPTNGPAGLSESAYSFETDDALFMVMNTQDSIKPQLDWMRQVASLSSKKWKIVLMHRGMYSGFYNESELRAAITPAFDEMGIDLVLNGHDHTYLRTTMKDGVKTIPGNGTTYVTGGSSANKYYDAVPRNWTEVLYDTNNPVFTVFEVLPDRISVISSHIEGGRTVEHDRFEIVKR